MVAEWIARALSLVRFRTGVTHEPNDTDLLAMTKFQQWQRDKTYQRQAWLKHGIQFPRTSLQDQQDALFSAMEARMHAERNATNVQRRLEIDAARRDALLTDLKRTLDDDIGE